MKEYFKQVFIVLFIFMMLFLFGLYVWFFSWVIRTESLFGFIALIVIAVLGTAWSLYDINKKY